MTGVQKEPNCNIHGAPNCSHCCGARGSLRRDIYDTLHDGPATLVQLHKHFDANTAPGNRLKSNLHRLVTVGVVDCWALASAAHYAIAGTHFPSSINQNGAIRGYIEPPPVKEPITRIYHLPDDLKQCQAELLDAKKLIEVQQQDYHRIAERNASLAEVNALLETDHGKIRTEIGSIEMKRITGHN